MHAIHVVEVMDICATGTIVEAIEMAAARTVRLRIVIVTDTAVIVAAGQCLAVGLAAMVVVVEEETCVELEKCLAHATRGNGDRKVSSHTR